MFVDTQRENFQEAKIVLLQATPEYQFEFFESSASGCQDSPTTTTVSVFRQWQFFPLGEIAISLESFVP
jgi:hypothetical protein